MFWAGGTLPRISRTGVGEAACPGCILEAGPTGFADRLEVGVKGRSQRAPGLWPEQPDRHSCTGLDRDVLEPFSEGRFKPESETPIRPPHTRESSGGRSEV